MLYILFRIPVVHAVDPNEGLYISGGMANESEAIYNSDDDEKRYAISRQEGAFILLALRQR